MDRIAIQTKVLTRYDLFQHRNDMVRFRLRMNHRFVRTPLGLLGLALITLSWVLSTHLLWSAPALSSMYGQYAFGLTSLGWEVVIATFGLGVVVFLYASLPIFHKRAILQTAARN